MVPLTCRSAALQQVMNVRFGPFVLIYTIGGEPIFAARALGGQRDIKSRRCLNEIYYCASADPHWHIDAVGGGGHIIKAMLTFSYCLSCRWTAIRG